MSGTINIEQKDTKENIERKNLITMTIITIQERAIIKEGAMRILTTKSRTNRKSSKSKRKKKSITQRLNKLRMKSPRKSP
jgi:hypothetical protein